MKHLTRLFLIILIFSISSCAYYEKLFKKTSKPFTPNVTSTTNIVIDTLWSIDSGDGSDFDSAVLQTSLDKNDNAYVIDSDGLITSINYMNGDKNWSTNLNLDVTSGITFYKDIIFFGTADGKLYAYNVERLKSSKSFFELIEVPLLNEGEVIKPKWNIQLNSEVSNPVTGADNNIFFKTNDGDTYSVNLNTGSINWKNINRNIVLSLRGSGSLTTDSESVYVARDDGTLVSLSQDSGKLNWYVSISPKSGRTELESLRDVEMTPYNDFGVIYVGSYQGNLIAVDSLSGSLLWSQPISVTTNLAVDDKNIYTSSTDGYLYSIGKYDGKVFWKTQLIEGKFLTQPLLYDKKIIVINESGFASVIDKNNGNILKYEKIMGEVDYQTRIIKINKGFLILSKDGRLTAFNIDERDYEKFDFFSW
ncbi:MAG: PQQ-binding-like beta-propeller repeat protein [Pseudomonadota bacterium]|nr:PQQ-binding-like beta-propeller repeat protein [Pseudomonadota bacterium]